MYNKLVNNVSKHMSNHPALYITKNINCTLCKNLCTTYRTMYNHILISKTDFIIFSASYYHRGWI